MNTRTGIVPALGVWIAAHVAALAEAAQGRWLFTWGRERVRPPHRHRSASHTLPKSGPVWVVVWERPPVRAIIARKCWASCRWYGGRHLRRPSVRQAEAMLVRRDIFRCMGSGGE